jgi:uncharacterized protein (DUF1684 family)
MDFVWKDKIHWKRMVRNAIEILLFVFVSVLRSTFPSGAMGRPQNEAGHSEVVEGIKNFRKERDAFFKSHERSPLRFADKLKFGNLRYYPVDVEYRFVGKIDRYVLDTRDPQYYATFMTNKGTKKRYVRYGQFPFTLKDKKYVLQLYKSILSDALFIPFKDKTNGKETYSGGRYLDAEIFVPEYEATIDFNMAYNPSCAYNEKIICALPPEENALDIEIHAGEKKFP